jgi:hypothetical protein
MSQSPLSETRPTIKTADDDETVPESLLLASTTLASLLSAVLQQISKHFQTAAESSTLKSIEFQLVRLAAEVTELEKLIGAYVQHEEFTTESIDLDPALFEWIAECVSTINDVQDIVTKLVEGNQQHDGFAQSKGKAVEKKHDAEHDDEDGVLVSSASASASDDEDDWSVVSASDSAYDIIDDESAPEINAVPPTVKQSTVLLNRETRDALESMYHDLEGHAAQIEEFMPILRADHDTFVSRCNIPNTALSWRVSTPTPVNSKSSARLERWDRSYNNHVADLPIRKLRAALYTLSDSIKAFQADLMKYKQRLRVGPLFDPLNETCKPSIAEIDDKDDVDDDLPHDFPQAVLRALSALHHLQDCTLSGLTAILTNNGSEWIESMLSGQLSYAEFQSWDAAAVLNLAQEFDERRTALRVFRRNWLPRPGGVTQMLDHVEVWKKAAVDLNKALRIPFADEEGGCHDTI